MRGAYAPGVSFAGDLANKTRFMVQARTAQDGPGYSTKTVTFDVPTLKALREEPGSDAAKVFNLVRGLRVEIERDRNMAPVLQPLRERAERILKDFQNRNVTSLAAMDLLEALANEKEAAVEAAKDSGLSTRGFGVYWILKDDTALESAGVLAAQLAEKAETLFARFPNAPVNADEFRRLRAALYGPLLEVDKDQRSRIIDAILQILLDTDTDASK